VLEQAVLVLAAAVAAQVVLVTQVAARLEMVVLDLPQI
jgi:hypothetical protein